MKRFIVLLLLLTIVLGAACARKSGENTGRGGKPAGTVTGDYALEEKDGRMVFTSQKAGRFSYTVSGSDEIKDDMFAVSGILAMEDFSEKSGAAESGSFNRYTLTFESNGPFKGTVTYRSDGEIVSEEFYLEAGGGSFRSFIDGAFEGCRAQKLLKIEVLPLKKERNLFVLTGLVLEEGKEVDLPDENDVVFLENDRFKFGAGVNWGGAVVWFEDKQDPIAGVTNMINRHDTGRLVQQSYYGTGPIEGVYDPGSFMNTTWTYNPVQGGDKGNTPSRIVDITVDGDTMYVKAQPRDWGRVGVLLPCYMENKYTLYGDHVLVENRFVDFSGFDHPYRIQELPAFYTLSYLDAMVYYDGKEPWTGAPLTVLEELSNWADPDNQGQNLFYITNGNTETWIAWINQADGYGVGFYTPNIKMLHAGRYNYDGSKSDTADPTNYVAPRCDLKITCFEPVSYSYILTAGTVDGMRDIFTKHKNFTYNVDLTLKAKQEGTDELFDFTGLDFTKAGAEKVFTGLNNTEVSFDENEGAALFSVTDPDDVYAALSLVDNADREMMAEDYDVIEFECMAPVTNAMKSYTIELFLAAGENTAAMAGLSVTATIPNDGEYHRIVLPVSGKSFWSGTVNRIRFDYFTDCGAGDKFYIKSFALKNTGSGNTASAIDFTSAEGLYRIAGTRDTVVSFDSNIGATMLLVTDGSDVNVSFDYYSDKEPLKGEAFDSIVIEYMIPTSNKRKSYDFEMYLCIGGVDGYTEDNSARGKYIADGEFHTLTVPLSAFGTHAGKMLSLRYDYFSRAAEGDVIYLKSVRLE